MLFFVLIILSLYLAYLYFTWKYDYWHKRNVKFEKPLPFFGNTTDLFFFRKSLTQYLTEKYRIFPEEKLIGYFNGRRPQLIIRDPDLIKRILITDFSNFFSRGLILNEAFREPLLDNLFFADGDLWKLLRQRMTPAFTSGKLKAMFPIIVELSENLQHRVGLIVDKNPEGVDLDARDLMARYTTDFIGAIGLGLSSASLEDDDSAFRKLGKQIFSVSFPDAVKGGLKEAFPNFFRRIRMTGRIEDELTDLVMEIIKQRNYKPSNRHDFIDLLLECQKKGTIVGESIEKFKPDGSPGEATLEMTDRLIIAQVFVFFAAGFETSSSATSFTLHQLAFNPEKQKKAQEEIDRILAKYNNKLCYDAIKEMTYLTWAFKEAMRIFPSLGFLMRINKQKFIISEMDVTLDEGVKVFIPLQAIHNDPKYFENPETFRPERFSPKEWDPKNNFIYMPFGSGPRACIGERLGLMQSVAGLAAILAKYDVSPSPRTVRHPRVSPVSRIVQTVKDGIPLQFKHRNIAV